MSRKLGLDIFQSLPFTYKAEYCVSQTHSQVGGGGGAPWYSVQEVGHDV